MGNILLVDDDPDIGMALLDYLQQEGFSVEMAPTAHDAIQKSQHHPYDVVLLDVGLPDRDGIEVLDDLSRQHPQLPVILLTAFTSLRKTADPAILNKAFAYLTKPYNRLEVKQTIQRALGAHTAMTESDQIVPDIFSAFLPFKTSTPIKREEAPFSLNLQQYERLAQYVQLMQFAFDHVPAAVFVAGPDKRFCFANKAACESLGYTREELLALRIPDISPHHDTFQYHQDLETLTHGQPLTYTSVHRAKDGREFPIEISVSLLHFHGQDYTCAITKRLSSVDTPSDTTVSTSHLLSH